MALRKPQKNVEALESLIRYPSQKSFFFAFENQKVTRNKQFNSSKQVVLVSCITLPSDKFLGIRMVISPILCIFVPKMYIYG